MVGEVKINEKHSNETPEIWDLICEIKGKGDFGRSAQRVSLPDEVKFSSFEFRDHY